MDKIDFIENKALFSKHIGEGYIFQLNHIYTFS